MDESTNDEFEVWTFLKKTILTAIIAGTFLFVIGKQNWSFIVNHTSLWGIPEYTLLRDYISLILSWPIVTLILVLTFFYKFPYSISKFLENSHLKTPITAPNKKEDSQVEKTETNIIKLPADDQKSTTGSQVNKEQSLPSKDSSSTDQYEFAYLNLYLVWDTKIALASFFSSPYKQADFINSYTLARTTTNPEVEKTAILQALVENTLIEIDRTTRTITVTKKGERFLKAIGIIPNTLEGWSHN